MKKLLPLLLSLALLFSLAACGGDTGSPAPEASAPGGTVPQEPATPSDTPDVGGGVEVEQNLFSVELTVPADFAGEDVTQEDLDRAVEEKGFKSATLNDDGSVTYVMTKAQHAQLMEETAASIDAALDEMVSAGDYPSFTEIEANGDYTEFTVTINATELGLMESFSTVAFYMFGGMYQAFNGTEADDIAVYFVNADSGEVVSEAHSSDMGE